MAPFLGVYRNDALGEAEPRLEEGRLTIDAGAFASVLQATAAGDGTYVATTPPFPGTVRTFATTQGEPTLAMGRGAEAYTFLRR